MTLTFDPSMLPDPLPLGRLRDLSYQARQAQPIQAAEWYTPVLQFGQPGLAVSAPQNIIGIWGRFADTFSVPIPNGAISAIFDVVYTNYDGAELDVAQGTRFDYINYLRFPRASTNQRSTFTFPIDPLNARRILTYWTQSSSPFGGFWMGQLSWQYGSPSPASLLGRVGVLPVMWDCVPIAWTLSSYSPGSLTLRLMYADYANFPTYSVLSTQHAPVLASGRRSRYSEIPSIAGWQSILRREGEIEVWVDAAAGVDQVELVLYLRKILGR